MKYIDRFINAMLGDLDPTGMAYARAGVFILGVGIAMSIDYGFAVSWKHALLLGCVTFIAAFGPEAIYRAYERRKLFIAACIAVIALPMMVIQFGIDQSYTAGLRGQNRDEARVQNTKYDGAQDGVKEAKAKLVIFTKQLETLTEQAPWAATVKALDLRAQAAQLEQNIASETKLGGCGRKCRGLQDDLTKVRNQIAVAEQRYDIETQIAATQRVIDGAREVANKTEHKSSAVVHANTQIAKAVAFFSSGSLTPTASIEEGTDISTNSAIAFAASTGHALCFLIAVSLYRRDGYSAESSRPTSTDVQPRTPTYSAPAPKGMHPDMAAIMGMLKGSNLNATSNTIGRAAGLA